MKYFLLFALTIYVSSLEAFHCNKSNYHKFVKNYSLTKELIKKTGNGCILTGINFANKEVSSVYLLHANLILSNFSFSYINKSDFKDADFSGAILYKARVSNSQFVNVDFRNSQIKEGEFINSSFINSNFRNANAIGNNFQGSKLINAVFHGANLTNASFKDADLSWSDFRGAYIKGADFSGANLRGTKF